MPLYPAASSGSGEPVLVQGTLVARPAASTFGVGYYFDGATLWHSDGTNWTGIADSPVSGNVYLWHTFR